MELIVLYRKLYKTYNNELTWNLVVRYRVTLYHNLNNIILHEHVGDEISWKLIFLNTRIILSGVFFLLGFGSNNQ